MTWVIKPTSTPRGEGFVNWVTVNDEAKKIIEGEKARRDKFLRKMREAATASLPPKGRDL